MTRRQKEILVSDLALIRTQIEAVQRRGSVGPLGNEELELIVRQIRV